MTDADTIKDRILESIRDSGGMTSKQLIEAFPAVKKQTIYVTIDRLHHVGAIRRIGMPGLRATRYVIADDSAQSLTAAMSRWHPPLDVDSAA